MNFAYEPKWQLEPREAIAFQRELAQKVILEDRVSQVEIVVAVDLALGRFANTGRAAALAWRASDGAVLEEVALELPLTLPYIPGLLAFREGPLVEAALREMRTEPDVVLVDGQGIAHPRRLGIAAHLGVLLDRPTVGVAKSRLFGRGEEPGPTPGDRTPLLAPTGETIGVLLRSRARSRPLWVSPGQYVTSVTAGEIAWNCVRGHRLPEPVFLADRLSKSHKKGLETSVNGVSP